MKRLPESWTIEQLRRAKTLPELLADGDLFTPETAAPRLGYTAMHVRYLCRHDRIEHVKHGGRYYLYARTVNRGNFEHVAVSSKRS